MNIDIRLSLEFFNHPKTKKLSKRLGNEGILCLLKLWSWVAKNRASGALTGLDVEAIELAADWHGEDGVFCSSLVEIGFLDDSGTGYAIHDWETHQAYACKSDERSEKAKRAANARWGKVSTLNDTHSSSTYINDTLSAPCSPDASSINEHAPSNAPVTSNQKPEAIIPPIPPKGVTGTGLNPAPALQVSGKKTRSQTGNSKTDIQNAIKAYTDSDGLQQALEDFRVMRERKRAPLTAAALALSLKQLDRLGGSNTALKQAIVEQSIQRGWQGLFPLRDNDHLLPTGTDGKIEFSSGW